MFLAQLISDVPDVSLSVIANPVIQLTLGAFKWRSSELSKPQKGKVVRFNPNPGHMSTIESVCSPCCNVEHCTAVVGRWQHVSNSDPWRCLLITNRSKHIQALQIKEMICSLKQKTPMSAADWSREHLAGCMQKDYAPVAPNMELSAQTMRPCTDLILVL